jgi:hypothetical protein
MLRAPFARGESSKRAGKTWMAPGVAQGTLVYAGGDEESYVLTYPAGKLVGNIAGTSFGMCTDPQGDVFFTRARIIVEYRHGGSAPVAIYNVPGTAYACSVDPVTGNLAAVVLCFGSCTAEIALFGPGDTQPAKLYLDPTLPSLRYCGYDNQGNLFVDGYNDSQFGFAELPVGSSTFTAITLNQNIQFAGQVQWDGQYITVETPFHPEIYQFRISGSKGLAVGNTLLSGVGYKATQSWILNGKVVVPTAPYTKRPLELIFWKYPAGGAPIHTFDGFIGPGHQEIDGAVFSVAPHA